MQSGTPSRTARGAALYRAAHQLADHPPVLADPLALKIVGEDVRAPSAALERRKSRGLSPLRAFVAVRSRYAEDRFEHAYERGVRQYLVLGAGLDTYAYRCPLDGVHVLEVDHPSSQALKLERLARAGIAIPPFVSFTSIDFEQETLREGLGRARFDPSRPAYVAWLGVTPYLPAETVLCTLSIVAEDFAAGSEIVFDFATPPGRTLRSFLARQNLAVRARLAGEPLRSTFTLPALANRVLSLGFSRVEIAETDTLNALYFEGREDGLRLRGGQLLGARL